MKEGKGPGRPKKPRGVDPGVWRRWGRREQLRISRREMAALMGVTYTRLWRLETGSTRLTDAMARLYDEALDRAVVELKEAIG